MKLHLIFVVSFFFAAVDSFTQTPKKYSEKKPVLLPNGWQLTPAGRSLPLGDLPLNMALSPSKKWIAVTNNGQSVQSIQLIDARSEKVLHTEVVPKSWYGLKFSADEKFLYASGGNDNWIMQYAVTGNKLVLKDTIKLGKKWPEKISPAGLEIDDKAGMMYVVTKENNSLYAIDLSTKQVAAQYPLGAEAYACLFSPNKKLLYISLWR
jgi:DNA-binding beta-propeller fold protein YncE